MTDKELYEIQVEREALMLDEGVERFKAGLSDLNKRSEGSQASPVKRLLMAALPEASPYLSELVESKLSTTKSGKRMQVLRGIRGVGVEAAVVIGLKVSFDKLPHKDDLRSTCIVIGQEIELQLWAGKMREEDPKEFGRIFKKVKRINHRKKVLKGSGRSMGWQEWGQTEHLRVGMFVVNALLRSTGLFKVEERWSAKHKGNLKYLVLSDEAAGCLEELQDLLSVCHPVFRPMVVPPNDWKSYEGGPYITEGANKRCTLVKSRGIPSVINGAIDSGGMDEALDAINIIQRTGYRINKRVLEAVEWAWSLDLGGNAGLKKLPKASKLEIPSLPEDLSKEDAWRFKKEQSNLHEMNRAIESSAIAYHRTIQEARDLLQYDKFYLPHSLDSRGRIYPMCHFNHQREDYVSALFEFSDGIPLGANGHRWIAHQIVGCGEFDGIHKLALRSRYDWVESNSEWICDIARNPYTNTEWINADKPFKFLAACFEWEGYRRSCRMGKGPSYRSRLPIHLDGSNSGVQHYAAALRSSKDAKLVNLTNSGDTPEDLYKAVSDEVNRRLREDERGFGVGTGSRTAKSDDRDAVEAWISHGVTRSTVKRQVMTYGYSSGKYGFADQLDEDLMRPLRADLLAKTIDEHPFGSWEEQQKACRFLAGLIWDSILDTVGAVKEGMSYFQDCAKLMNLADQPLRWTTPTGLPVVQRYTKDDRKVVELFLFNDKVPLEKAREYDEIDHEGNVFSRIRMNLVKKGTGPLDKLKQKSAVSPNVVHSLDAAHLSKVVLAADIEGINSFSLIHDSFATHAGNTSRFFEIIREQFLEMYEEYDIFEELKRANLEYLPEELRGMWPIPPSKGDFDLKEVLDSPFSFG